MVLASSSQSICWKIPRIDIKELASSLCHRDSFFSTPHDDKRVKEILNGEIYYRERLIKVVEWQVPSNLEESLLSSWKFYYHSLVWLAPLRRHYRLVANMDYVSTYVGKVQDWLDSYGTPPRPLPTQQDPGDYTWYDMSAAWRTMIIIGVLSLVGANDFFLKHLETHAYVLSREDYYAGVGNHALHQNFALLCAALILDRDDYFQLSLDRIRSLRSISIDDEGVALEGSVGYHLFNLYWWSNMDCLLEKASNLVEGVQDIQIPDMRPFLRYAVAPDGKIVPLGDSTMIRGPYLGVISEYPTEFVHYIECDSRLLYVLTQGLRGEQLSDTMRVFSDGYWFSRANTDGRRPEEQSHASLRFGPGLSTRVHSHDDAGAVTFYPRGIRVLEDGGLFGYYGGEKREFVKSSRAHSTILVNGRKYYRSAKSTLEFAIAGNDFDQAVVRVAAIEKTRWTRVIAHARNEDFLFIQDHIITNGASYQQIFNLGDGFEVTGMRKGRIDAVNVDGAKVSLIWLTGDACPGLSRGRTGPLMGWRSTFEGELHPISCVTADHAILDEGVTGKSALIVLLLANSEDFADVYISDIRFSKSRTKFTLHRYNSFFDCEIYINNFHKESKILRIK